MKNNIIILIMLVALMSACGTFKKAATVPDTTTTTPATPRATTDAMESIIATLGDWQTMQTGGNIKLSAGSSFSSAIQVRMVRDQAIYISLRPMLGIEVGKMLITADSLYAVDKVHKRYIAEKVSVLTAGIPVTVSDVQDIFLGRAFIIGKGTLNQAMKGLVNLVQDHGTTALAPAEHYRGYGYAFTIDKASRVTALNITREGRTTPACKVKYSKVTSTPAGNIAHGIDVDAAIEKRKLSFSMSYKQIDWNGQVKIDRNIPNGYKRMNAADLFSIFSN